MARAKLGHFWRSALHDRLFFTLFTKHLKIHLDMEMLKAKRRLKICAIG